MTVTELLARIPAAELTDWAAYERLSGTLGPERADLHAGIIAAVIANVNRAKGGRRFRPADFIPTWDRPGASTPQQMATLLKSWSKKIIRRGEA